MNRINRAHWRMACACFLDQCARSDKNDSSRQRACIRYQLISWWTHSLELTCAGNRWLTSVSIADPARAKKSAETGRESICSPGNRTSAMGRIGGKISLYNWTRQSTLSKLTFWKSRRKRLDPLVLSLPTHLYSSSCRAKSPRSMGHSAEQKTALHRSDF